MKFRKFRILSVELSPGGTGPERAWRVTYEAIKDKKWMKGTLWSVASTAAQARERAMQRFGGKE